MQLSTSNFRMVSLRKKPKGDRKPQQKGDRKPQQKGGRKPQQKGDRKPQQKGELDQRLRSSCTKLDDGKNKAEIRRVVAR